MTDMKPVRQWVAVTGVLVPVLLTGCAANLTDDEMFEQEYAAVERKESIRAFIESCEAGNNVVYYTGPSTHRLRDPIKRIPSHARRSEYECTNSSEIERMQAEMGLR